MSVDVCHKRLFSEPNSEDSSQQVSEEKDITKKYNDQVHVPMSLLREYNLSKKEIVEANNEIILGDQSWPKTAKTNFLIAGSGKAGAPKDFYTLESVLFCLKNHHLFHPLYVEQAIAKNIPHVRRPDRKNLLGYLNGFINDNLPSIVVEASGKKTEIKDAPEELNKQNQAPPAKKQKLQKNIWKTNKKRDKFRTK